MQKLLIAYAALGLLAVATSVNAQSPAEIVHDAVATAQSVQADAVVSGAMIDNHAIAQPSLGETIVQPMNQTIVQPMEQSYVQPMDQSYGVTQGHNAVVSQPYAVQQQPVHYHHHPQSHQHAAKKQNVFQKLLELERKKNAWLKKTFLGK